MSKLIFDDVVFAAELVTEMKRYNPDNEYAMYPLGAGRYQVVQITKLAGAGRAWVEGRWANWTPAQITEAVSEGVKPVPEHAVVTVSVPFAGESPAWLEIMQDGVKRYFKKSALISWTIVEQVVEITLPAKVATKRGLA